MANPCTLVDGKLLLNSQIVRDYVCAMCFGALTAKVSGGFDVVACAENSGHRGFMKAMAAHAIQAEIDHWQSEAERKELTKEELESQAKQDREDLWGPQ